ncbi:MAG TPA: hypothetical protein VIV15_13375 [Anaerolineales bacterium]
MKRIALITGTVITLVVTLVMAGAAARPTGSTSGNSARAIIHGCQYHDSPAGAIFPPIWENWNSRYGGWSAGGFRIAAECGRVNFTPYSSGWRFFPQECINARAALQDPDTLDIRYTPWVTACPGQSTVLLVSFGLIVNQRAWVEARSANANHRNDTNFWYGIVSM